MLRDVKNCFALTIQSCHSTVQSIYTVKNRYKKQGNKPKKVYAALPTELQAHLQCCKVGLTGVEPVTCRFEFEVTLFYDTCLRTFKIQGNNLQGTLSLPIHSAIPYTGAGIEPA
jgi:hypothetical protein